MSTALTLRAYRVRNRTISVDLSLWFGLALSIAGAVSALASDIASSVIIALGIIALVLSRHLPTPILQWSLVIILALTCLSSLLGQPFGRLSWLANINLVGYLAAILMIVVVDLIVSHPDASTALSWLEIDLLVLSACTLLAVNSTGAYVAAFLPSAYLWWTNGNRRLALVWLMVVPAALIGNQYSSYTQRWVIWLSVLQSPSMSLPSRALHAHNLILEVVHRAGYLAGGLALVGFVILIIGLLRSGRSGTAMAISLAISSAVDYIYWYPFILSIMAMWIVWSLRIDHAPQS